MWQTLENHFSGDRTVENIKEESDDDKGNASNNDDDESSSNSDDNKNASNSGGKEDKEYVRNSDDNANDSSSDDFDADEEALSDTSDYSVTRRENKLARTKALARARLPAQPNVTKKPKKTFECFECHKEFATTKSKAQCREHIRAHTVDHDKCICCSRPAITVYPLACFFCDQEFPRKKLYYAHGKVDHKLSTVQVKLSLQICKRCTVELNKKSFDERRIEMDQSIRRHRVQINFKCNRCERAFKQSKSLKLHKCAGTVQQ